MGKGIRLAVVATAVAAVLAPALALGFDGVVTKVSVATDGTPGNSYSSSPAISGDGRFVAFTSYSTNLIPADLNSRIDVFRHDRQTATTVLVSVAFDGAQGDGHSHTADDPAISGDGQIVAFTSAATNLVSGDTNGFDDIFVRDLAAGTTERVSVSSLGTQASLPNGGSSGVAISGDGRFVAFSSDAKDLAPDNNQSSDVFVHDRETGNTDIVSVSDLGQQGLANSFDPSLSADGRFVAFWSAVDTLVPDDTNGAADVFVRDRELGTTRRVSVASDGSEANSNSNRPAISGDGRFVAFSSDASNLAAVDGNGRRDFFIHDLQTGETELLSVATDGTQANDASSLFATASLSHDGNLAAFESRASNLAPGNANGNAADIFLRDRAAGTTELVSRTPADTGGDSDSFAPSLAANAPLPTVAFWSRASDLVPGSPGNPDVFVFEEDPCTITGTEGDDIIIAPDRGDVDDVICGLGGNDVLKGFGGDDVLIGGPGDDHLIGGSGADTIDGGAGRDVAAFNGRAGQATGPVNADLSVPAVENDGTGSADAIASDEGGVSTIEDLRGSDFGDTLLGDDRRNRINGEPGGDILSGAGGNDRLLGRGGFDLLAGGEGNDVLYGQAGGDTILGEGGDDRVYPGLGNDTTINGGAGDDQLRYDDIQGPGGIVVDLESGNVSGAAGDDIVAGASFARLVGTPQDDTLNAAFSDPDQLTIMIGRAGSDTMSTADGAGADVINAVAGQRAGDIDTCLFDTGPFPEGDRRGNGCEVKNPPDAKRANAAR